MKKYLLSEKGQFYKANLHCHTNLSDGKKTPEQVKELYKSLGYSIVAFTDHDIFIPHPELNDDTFLALHGFEAEINENKPLDWHEVKCCHICFIALDPTTKEQPCWHRTKYLFGNAINQRDKVKFDENEPDFEREYSPYGITKLMNSVRDKGFFVTYNHPTWSKETYPDYIDYFGMHAFEMYNGACITSGYDDYNPRVYEDYLQLGRKLYCIGADDNHNFYPDGTRKCDSGRAFTMIKAENLEYRAITKALISGQFYASEGPEIYELYYEDGFVHIKCSDADRIACTYGIRKAQCQYNEESGIITEAAFKVEPTDKYFRLTVTDKSGKTACTNAYFLEDII